VSIFGFPPCRPIPLLALASFPSFSNFLVVDLHGFCTKHFQHADNCLCGQLTSTTVEVDALSGWI
jgi:hypothetical protein